MSGKKIYSGYCEACGKPCRGRWCSKHYHQMQRYGFIKERTRFDKNEIVVKGDIAEISLYDNNSNVIDYTIIDTDDIDKVKDYKISKSGKYATANINNKTVPLHRIITETVDREDKRQIVIDHINGNGLDNRKCNLRIVNQSVNGYNGYRQRDGKTGVRKHIQKGKYVSYQAYISINKKQINLGYFPTEEEAVTARKDAEIKYGIIDNINRDHSLEKANMIKEELEGLGYEF